MEIFTYNLLLAVITYTIGTASPGPSNLAIAYISVHSGRSPALIFASGVIVGSFLWGATIALGLFSVLITYPNVLYILKILAAIYFIYLGYLALKKSFMKKNTDIVVNPIGYSKMRQFLSGLLFHLLNPKALAVWTTIITIALPMDVAIHTNVILFIPVFACLPLGMLIFYGYAFIFSKELVVERYFRHGKIIDSFVGLTFISLAVWLIVLNQ